MIVVETMRQGGNLKSQKSCIFVNSLQIVAVTQNISHDFQYL